VLRRWQRRILNQPVVAVLYAGIGALLVAIAAELARNGIAALAANSTVWLSFIIIFVLGLGAAQLAALRERVDRLVRRTGQTIRYFDTSTVEGTVELYQQAAKEVQRAQATQILAVNSWLEVSGSYHDSQQADAAQRNYLDALQNRADCDYHRLIQRPQFGLVHRGMRRSQLAADLAQPYLEHYRWMAVQAESGGRVKLEEVAAYSPTSFVVLSNDLSGHGGGVVILQEHRHDPASPNKLKMIGVLIIRDPSGQLVSTYVNRFRRIDSQQPRRLRSADLADPGEQRDVG
jgi:hypothetical protein